MNCELVEIEGRPGFQWCPKCKRGRAYPNEQRRPMKIPERYSRECTVMRPAESPPTMRERVANFTDATAEWIAAGMPVRTTDQEHSLAAICESCEHYVADPILPIVMGGGQCGVCGCGIQPERKLLNALRYATYRCKKGKWDGAIARFTSQDAP